MPERSFGRTVRYRRTKLGLSQAKLGELVGRSAGAVRSWEKDKSIPNDDGVLTALAAILGIDKRHLYDKAGQTVPVAVESSPTIEQELATLGPRELLPIEPDSEPFEDAIEWESPLEPEPQHSEDVINTESTPEQEEPSVEPDVAPVVVAAPAPAYKAPPSPHSVTAATPRLYEPSYMEDTTQRQLYRVRYLATLVVLVALVIAFLWALSQGVGAWGTWWDQFFGSLRL